MKKTTQEKLTVILIGPPGAGKGTQAELLADKLNLYHLETSQVLESRIMGAKKGEYAVVEGKKYFFSQAKKQWKTGQLVYRPLTTFWMRTKIRELAKEGKNLVLTGSPRDLYEGERLMPVLKKLYGKENIKVIILKLNPKKSIWRNSHRRICQLMRHPILYSKETTKLTKCPLDGSVLLKRKGLDNPKTIKIRLKVYQKHTFPLVEYFQKEKYKIKEVNGDQSVAKVFQDILKALQF